MIEKPKFLETKRLRLRPIQLSDIPVVQKYSLDPEWHRFLDFHTTEGNGLFLHAVLFNNILILIVTKDCHCID